MEKNKSENILDCGDRMKRSACACCLPFVSQGGIAGIADSCRGSRKVIPRLHLA